MSINGLGPLLTHLPPEERRRVLLRAMAMQPGVSLERVLDLERRTRPPAQRDEEKPPPLTTPTEA